MVFDIAQVNMIKLVAKKFPAFRKLVWSIFFWPVTSNGEAKDCGPCVSLSNRVVKASQNTQTHLSSCWFQGWNWHDVPKEAPTGAGRCQQEASRAGCPESYGRTYRRLWQGWYFKWDWLVGELAWYCFCSLLLFNCCCCVFLLLLSLSLWWWSRWCCCWWSWSWLWLWCCSCHSCACFTTISV